MESVEGVRTLKHSALPRVLMRRSWGEKGQSFKEVVAALWGQGGVDFHQTQQESLKDELGEEQREWRRGTGITYSRTHFKFLFTF